MSKEIENKEGSNPWRKDDKFRLDMLNVLDGWVI